MNAIPKASASCPRVVAWAALAASYHAQGLWGSATRRWMALTSRGMSSLRCDRFESRLEPRLHQRPQPPCVRAVMLGVPLARTEAHDGVPPRREARHYKPLCALPGRELNPNVGVTRHVVGSRAPRACSSSAQAPSVRLLVAIALP